MTSPAPSSGSATPGGSSGTTGGIPKKIAGVPTGLAIAVVGGVILFYLWNRNRASATPTVVPQPYTGVGAGAGSGMGNSGGGTTNPVSTKPTTNEQWLEQALAAATDMGYSVTRAQPALSNWLMGAKISSDDALIVNTVEAKIGPPPQPPTGGGVQPTTGGTNQEWGQLAIKWLVNHGEQAVDATNAIVAYINGQTLSQYQGRLVNEAFQGFGTAPVLAPNSGPYGPGGLNSGQLNPIHYTTKAGDTWSSIAVQFGGSSELWTQIFNANVGLGMTGNASEQLPTGITIQIPWSVAGTDKKPIGTYT